MIIDIIIGVIGIIIVVTNIIFTKVELRVNKNPLRPRPRSVAVPNVEAVRAEEVTKLLAKTFFGYWST